MSIGKIPQAKRYPDGVNISPQQREVSLKAARAEIGTLAIA